MGSRSLISKTAAVKAIKKARAQWPEIDKRMKKYWPKARPIVEKALGHYGLDILVPLLEIAYTAADKHIREKADEK